MSKASEWAAIAEEAHRTRLMYVVRAGSNDRIEVAPVCLLNLEGRSRGLECQFERSGANPYRMWLTPSEALNMARWILDTFGPGPQAPRP